MKTNKKQFVVLISVFFVVLYAFFGSNVYAKVTNEKWTLHEKTKIYSINEKDFFTGCENYQNYQSSTPGITVLTHGLGSRASHWSNTLASGDSELAYNKASLITKISEQLNYNVDIYLADCQNKTVFTLTKYNWNFTSKAEVERINDASKHIILLFQSGDPSNSNDYVYEEFENVVDTVSLQYKSLTGVLPRLNLVGHSRGGLTNIMYATKHYYNVAAMYSLGTPYNGSALGACDGVLELLDYKMGEYPDGTNKYKPGVENILNKEEAIQIRDNWNKAYDPNSQLKVIALGSATSISYIDAFVQDVANGNSKYSLAVQNYTDLVSFIAELIKTLPKTTGATLDLIGGFAEVLDFFGINVYDEIITRFNEDWAGSLTVEEGNKILELYTVLNGEPVLMDDLFIDVNSQLGLFEDGNNFNGFIRRLKVFEPEDLNENRAIPSQPAVVHNMETMNASYTRYISTGLLYGTNIKSPEKIDDLGKINASFVGEKVVEFTPTATGIRTIDSNCTYSVCEKNGAEVSVENNQAKFVQGTTYYIVLQTDKKENVSLTLDISSNYGGLNYLTANSKYVYSISSINQGMYVLTSNNSSIVFYDLDGNRISHIYSNGSNKNYLIVHFTGREDCAVTLGFTTPSCINENESGDSYDMYDFVSITNTYGTPISYQLTLDKNAQVMFYNSSNSPLTYPSENGRSKKYSISILSGDTVYIHFLSDTDAQIMVEENQVFWFVNGVKVTASSYEIYSNRNYQVKLMTRNGEELHNVEDNYILSEETDWIKRAGSAVKVTDKALIGRTVTTHHMSYPNKVLTLKVIPLRIFTVNITNDDVITFDWSKVNYADQIKCVDWKIIYGSSSMNFSVTQKTYTLTSDELSRLSENCTFSLVAVQYEYGNFDSSYFSGYNNSFNAYYKGGSGTASSPYQINCGRHLKNISKHNSSYFKLTNDINLSSWTPIYFGGTLDGDNHDINYMSINCNGSINYGLFSSNSGTVKRIYFNSAVLSSSLESSIAWAGVVAGYNSGTIQYCYVIGATINAKTASACFGGIVGYNSGTIKNCSCRDSIITVSGNGGGIAGKNTGTITSSYVSSASITYVYTKPSSSSDYKAYNGNVGGLVGYNSGTVISCSAGGQITWYETNDKRDIYPSLGTLFGQNKGTYSDCNSYMGYNIHYYYWYFIGWYDQSGRCFKVDDGKVGYQPE